MITGELKSQIDAVWNDFWSGGISNPMDVMEQLTYLLFIKGLDERQTRLENQANRTGESIQKPVFPDGVFKPDDAMIGKPYENLRWGKFKNRSPQEMFEIVDRYVFPFMQTRTASTSHAQHMKGARLTIPTPGLLVKAVEGLDSIPMEDRDTKGDVYEYMLSKIASAGQNGQFRTPRHIIDLMVEMMEPTPLDAMCDPAAGTGGFEVGTYQYVWANHREAFSNESSLSHINNEMFTGYDFDTTMLRIGSMNMQLHGIENPKFNYRDSLSQEFAGEDIEKFTLVLANPPFAGSLDYEAAAKDLLQVVKTKKTELLFLALFLRILKPGGRAAVIVPDGVLFGSSKAHVALRKKLIEEQKLDGVISLPSGVFRPYAGVSTAILLFTKTNSGGTDNVWFYDLKADGLSLDDKRSLLVAEEDFGVRAHSSPDIHSKNNLPDVLSRWRNRDGDELKRSRLDQSFFVPKTEIVGNNYDISIGRYREIERDTIEFEKPAVLLGRLIDYEDETREKLVSLKALLDAH